MQRISVSREGGGELNDRFGGLLPPGQWIKHGWRQSSRKPRLNPVRTECAKHYIGATLGEGFEQPMVMGSRKDSADATGTFRP